MGDTTLERCSIQFPVPLLDTFQWPTRSIILFLSPPNQQQQQWSDSQKKKNWFHEIHFSFYNIYRACLQSHFFQLGYHWTTIKWWGALDSINQRPVWSVQETNRFYMPRLCWGENRNTARRGIHRTLSERQWPNRSHREWEEVVKKTGQRRNNTNCVNWFTIFSSRRLFRLTLDSTLEMTVSLPGQLTSWGGVVQGR